MNGLLCGEKITLAILLGNNTLWEERYFAEMLITPLGDTIDVLCWKMNSAGG